MDNVLPNDPLFSEQWYLHNTGQSGGTSGEDINVLPAWEIATGDGVVIGIVDGAIDLEHPDLNSQNSFFGGYDFIKNEIKRSNGGFFSQASSKFAEFLEDRDFSLDRSTTFSTLLDEKNLDFLDFLDSPSDLHGTPVAGIAVAANNDLGTVGVAYNADFSGFRVELGREITIEDFDTQIARAFSSHSINVDIFNNSWLPNIALQPFEQTTTALEREINSGRSWLGSIFVVAAGNNASEGGNVNYYPLANSRYTITVGALDHNGVRSDYSNPGSSLLISTYANTDDGGILTTDIQGEYGFDLSEYTEFIGTSAATPIVSGVIALMLEANPDLTWRDVQHILVRTAVKNDPNQIDWIENGAGYLVNHNYGFGSIDAGAAVTLALDWQTVAPEVSFSSPEIIVDTAVPDDNPDGIISTIEIDQDLTIESVEIVTDADIVQQDLEVVLISPSGTESVLSANDINIDREGVWTFTSLRHWGESSFGEWNLKVTDSETSDLETIWDSWKINVYGTDDNAKIEIDTVDENDIGYNAYGANGASGYTPDSYGSEGIYNESITSWTNLLEAPALASPAERPEAPIVSPKFRTGQSALLALSQALTFNTAELTEQNPEFQSNYTQDIIEQLQRSISTTASSYSNSDNTDEQNIGSAKKAFKSAYLSDNSLLLPNFENNPNFENALSPEVTIVEVESEEDLESINLAENEVAKIGDDVLVPAVTQSRDTHRVDYDDIGLPDYVNLPPDISIRSIEELQGEAVYRFLNTDLNVQFYTADEVEKDTIRLNLPNYEYQGVSFVAPFYKDDITGVNPVYRLRNSITGVHLYTISEAEKDNILETSPYYSLDGNGIGFYAYENQIEGTEPLYRFYNSSLDAHFYAPSIEERDEYIASPDFQIEGDDGIAFYVHPAP